MRREFEDKKKKQRKKEWMNKSTSPRMQRLGTQCSQSAMRKIPKVRCHLQPVKLGVELSPASSLANTG
jgi:hypothetical protein